MAVEASDSFRKPAQDAGANRPELQHKQGYTPETHRLLPQSLDAEKGILCSFMLDPDPVGNIAVESGLTAESFHLPAHRAIARIVLEMYDKKQPIDLITITQTLRDRNQLDEAGGAAYLAEVYTFLPTATNAAFYLEIVREKQTLRSLIHTCTGIAARCYDDQHDVAGLLDEAEAKVCAIAQDRFNEQVEPFRDLVIRSVADIERVHSLRGSLTGLATGFKNFDKMADGLHGSEMFVIAARPSMGKTAFAMNIAEHMAVELGKAVAVFSLEMSSHQLVQRMLGSLGRVDLARLRDGFFTEADFGNIQRAASKLLNAKIFVDDASSMNILELRAKARRLKDQHDIAAIFIDYLQLLRSPSRRAQDNRQIEIAEISAGLKGLAKELNIPVVVLAQLNRNPEGRTGESKGRPRLSDLRESGSIEQDADVVGLLFREEYYADNDEERAKLAGKAILNIAKQRNGPVGDVLLTFRKQFTRFEDRVEEPGEAENEPSRKKK